MCLKEMEREIAGWRIELLATDLSSEVLEKARQGLYTQFEVQRGLPIQLLIKHFTQIGELWQIAPEIRAMVKYRQLNLLDDFSQLGIVRPDLLPQRADLFRPGHQDRRAQSPGAASPPATAISCSAPRKRWSGLTDRFKMVADKRGLYAPNTEHAAAVGRDRREARPAPGRGQRRAVTAVVADCQAGLQTKTPASGRGFACRAAA